MFEGFFLVALIGIKVGVMVVCVMLCMAMMTLVERRFLAFMQCRLGPNQVGYFGILQPFADGLKNLFKEDFTPAGADKILYPLAPIIALIPALTAFAVIPFGPGIPEVANLLLMLEDKLLGVKSDLSSVVTLTAGDINVGVLFFMAVVAMEIYGVFLGGWSSNSKYSLLGGLRASAQMISYELSMTLSVLSIVMISGTLRLGDIVHMQERGWFIIIQPIGFVIFLICMLAETNRSPFDLPEAESELVAGFHTEYSSLKFAMFFMAEYVAMIGISSFCTTLYLGGFNGPFGLGSSILWFGMKTFLLLFFFIHVRATLPRFRYDQLMDFGWKTLLPLSLLNLMLTGFFLTVFR
ncbi:MAG: NADH-quinone oxidoreductase subunit NuoH [Candidatus Riflebacteria bacterium]|nr:NADH-quinone oxidoreductase subunit NuoH [Candidatus Riflebacteria bacterium]